MKKINGIVYLKAFLPLLVIAWHARFLGISGIMRVKDVYIPSITDIVYINIVNLAVPIFFLISFYLYLVKRKPSGNTKYLIKRVGKLVGIFLIWRAIYFIFGIGKLWIPKRGLIINLYHLLFGGGDTLLYYVQLLIYFLVFICSFCNKFNLNLKTIASIGLVLSGLLLLACYFITDYFKYEALRYFSPIAFIPLIFISMLITNSKCEIDTKYIFLLFSVGVVFAISEWLLIPDSAYISKGSFPAAAPIYSRLSQIAIACSLFFVFLKISKEPHKIVVRLSEVSLYAYCIHQIFISCISTYFKLSYFVLFVITVVLTYAFSLAIYAVKKYYYSRKRKNTKVFNKYGG